MTYDELIKQLALLTDAEFEQVASQARGVDDSDIRAVIVRELQRQPALNSDEIDRRALGG